MSDWDVSELERNARQYFGLPTEEKWYRRLLAAHNLASLAVVCLFLIAVLSLDLYKVVTDRLPVGTHAPVSDGPRFIVDRGAGRALDVVPCMVPTRPRRKQQPIVPGTTPATPSLSTPIVFGGLTSVATDRPPGNAKLKMRGIQKVRMDEDGRSIFEGEDIHVEFERVVVGQDRPTHVDFAQ
jgi:hypothetical protein